MNCFQHPLYAAVAQCIDCGKGLCSSCASKFSLSICSDCYNRRINTSRSEILKELLLTFGLGFILTFLVLKYDLWGLSNTKHVASIILMTGITFYATSGIVPGWNSLTAITPRVFLFLPIIGWFLYFIIKFFLSFFIGLIVLPFRTLRNIFQLFKLKNT